MYVSSIQYGGNERFWKRKLYMVSGQNIFNQFGIEIIHKELI